MISFLKLLPQAATRVADLVAKNMDWPGADQFAQRLMPPEFLSEEIKNLPDEIKGIVVAYQQQVQQLQEQLKQAGAMLGEKQSEHQLADKKIEKDFDAKMAKIAADIEIKTGLQIQDAMRQLQDAITGMEQAAELHQQQLAHANELQSKDIQHGNESQMQDMSHANELQTAQQEAAAQQSTGGA